MGKLDAPPLATVATVCTDTPIKPLNRCQMSVCLL